MTNLEFEDPNTGLGGYQQPIIRETRIVQFLIDKEIVNNRSQANHLLIGIVIFCFFLTTFIIKETFDTDFNIPSTIPEEILRMNRSIR